MIQEVVRQILTSDVGHDKSEGILAGFPGFTRIDDTHETQSRRGECSLLHPDPAPEIMGTRWT